MHTHPHTHTHTHSGIRMFPMSSAGCGDSLNQREVFTVAVENNDWLAGAWSASDRVGDSELCCRQLLCFRGKEGGRERERSIEGSARGEAGAGGGRRDLAGLGGKGCCELTVAPAGKPQNCVWSHISWGRYCRRRLCCYTLTPVCLTGSNRLYLLCFPSYSAFDRW